MKSTHPIRVDRRPRRRCCGRLPGPRAPDDRVCAPDAVRDLPPRSSGRGSRRSAGCSPVWARSGSCSSVGSPLTCQAPAGEIGCQAPGIEILAARGRCDVRGRGGPVGLGRASRLTPPAPVEPGAVTARMTAATDDRPIIAAMPVLRSRLDPASPEARANHEAMAALVAELRERQATVAGRGAGGDDRSIARHRERGKLPVRERIDRLARPGLGVPRAEPARRERPLRRRGAERRDRDRDRARSRGRGSSSSPTTRPSRAARTTR